MKTVDFANQRFRNTRILHVTKKRGFEQRGFLQSRVSRPGGQKIPRILGPAARLSLRAPQPREAYILAKTHF